MAEIGVCKTCGGMVSSEAAACPHCGQTDPFASDGLGEVELLARRGRKIEAIRRYRALTRKSLLEAKRYVDGLLREDAPQRPPASPDPSRPFLLLAVALAVALVAWLLLV